MSVKGIAKTVLRQKDIDLSFLEKVEDHLICCGIHVDIVSDIMNHIVRKILTKGSMSHSEVLFCLKEKIIKLIEDFAEPIDIDQAHTPQVILICGINGSGKTTTIGKMSHMLSSLGWDIAIAACDTFRSAADEQLRIWTSVPNSNLIFKEHDSETPSRIAVRAYNFALENKKDILIVDTAGRVHNNANLMQELRKLRQKLNQISRYAPHNVILIADANCGYSILNQVEMFKETVGLTGMIVTKVDIAKHPGFIISICKRFRIPIHGVSDGEKEDSIRDFEPIEFADAIINGLTEESGK